MTQIHKTRMILREHGVENDFAFFLPTRVRCSSAQSEIGTDLSRFCWTLISNILVQDEAGITLTYAQDVVVKCRYY